MDIKLTYCPHCGGTQNRTLTYVDFGGLWAVGCKGDLKTPGCGAEGPAVESKEEAAKLWNQRYDLKRQAISEMVKIGEELGEELAQNKLFRIERELSIVYERLSRMETILANDVGYVQSALDHVFEVIRE